MSYILENYTLYSTRCIFLYAPLVKHKIQFCEIDNIVTYDIAKIFYIGAFDSRNFRLL